MSSPSAFNRAEEYAADLERGISLSGEDQRFFLEGRVADLQRQLPPEFSPARVLDFGCGLGETTAHLADAFPGAEAVGVDTAEDALTHATELHGGPRVRFLPLRLLADTEKAPFDLAYVNGVFHHIPPDERGEQVLAVHRALRPGGYFAFFENNPWNPGARMVMRRIPFDRDSVMLNVAEARRLLESGGFTRVSTTSLFWFPRRLAPLRRLEPALRRVPLGAQYHLLAQRRPSDPD